MSSNLTKEEIKRRVSDDADFIAIKRFDFSLEKLLERYPDGVPLRIIAQALVCSEEQVEALYNRALLKLKSALRIQPDDEDVQEFSD